MISKVLSGLKDYSPEILVTTGVVGMITSTILAVKATPKALDLIEDEKDYLCTNNLTTTEIIKCAWKPYIPAIGVGVVSAACIAGGTRQNYKRNAALAALYATTENTLRTYQRKTEEIAGKEKADEIRREVVRDQVQQVNTTIIDQDNSQYIAYTGCGDTLIFDSFSGRYFKSSMVAIERAANQVNKSILSEQYMTVNDFYNELNVPTIDAGSEVGWLSEYDLIDILFESDMDTNGNPYLVMVHRNRPINIRKRY